MKLTAKDAITDEFHVVKSFSHPPKDILSKDVFLVFDSEEKFLEHQTTINFLKVSLKTT